MLWVSYSAKADSRTPSSFSRTDGVWMAPGVKTLKLAKTDPTRKEAHQDYETG